MKKLSLSDGTQAISFVGEDSSPKAIVHLSTLLRLAELLPKAKLKDILDNMARVLEALNYKKDATIEEYVEILRDELAFHESVNIIKEFKMPTLTTETVQLIINLCKESAWNEGNTGAVLANINQMTGAELQVLMQEIVHTGYENIAKKQDKTYVGEEINIYIPEEVYNAFKTRGLNVEELLKFTAFSPDAAPNNKRVQVP
jgi:post-segregation antitoxin (ccd killing protein)